MYCFAFVCNDLEAFNFQICVTLSTGKEIDDYAKDGGPGVSDFYVVFTMSLCALGLKQLLISLIFQIIRL